MHDDSYSVRVVSRTPICTLRCAAWLLATVTVLFAAKVAKSVGQRIPQPDPEHAEQPARRSGEDRRVYATHCWAAGSAFADPSCNCLGEPAHPKLSSRRTIKIVVGGWYVPTQPGFASGATLSTLSNC